MFLLNNEDLGKEINIPANSKSDSRGQIMNIVITKGVLGLGFCIEGGRNSVNGDVPVTVRRLFGGTWLFSDM